MGRSVAKYVAHRLGLFPATSSQMRASRPGVRFESDLITNWSAASASLAPAGVAPAWEQCHTAETMPVVAGAPAPWRLVDEGGAKGVKKLGLLSKTIGDRLLIGPIGAELQQQERQRLLDGLMTRRGWHPKLTVELGYLLAPREDFGALVLQCYNCTCKREVCECRLCAVGRPVSCPKPCDSSFCSSPPPFLDRVPYIYRPCACSTTRLPSSCIPSQASTPTHAFLQIHTSAILDSTPPSLPAPNSTCTSTYLTTTAATAGTRCRACCRLPMRMQGAD